MYKGTDYSKEITIKHLLSNTSGIPNYFTGHVVKELIAGKDTEWGFEKAISRVKQQKPKFAPGQKAQYVDVNFRLLGKIIETITEQDLELVFQSDIFDQLQLENTYVYQDGNDRQPAPIYYKNKVLHLPKYMASIGAEGGIVSTAQETMRFLKAFMSGQFFPKEYVDELKEWKIVFYPGIFYYGVGIERQPLSITDLKNGLLGHWGQTGAFAFYHPETDLYVTGTVNQVIGHRIAGQLLGKIVQAAK